MSRPRNGTLALWPLPPSWAWMPVRDIGTVALGRQRSPDNHNGPQMRPYVRAANITWNGWDLADVKEMNFDEADFTRFRLKPGDVLLNEGSGSAKEVGKPAIWRGQIEECCFQNTLVRVQPSRCSSEYLHAYFLYCALTERFVSETKGVNIHHIGKEGLAAYPMPLPPRPEQTRIVAKVNNLSAMSRRAHGRLDHIPRLVEKYKQTILAAAFSGELTRQWRKQHPSLTEWTMQKWEAAGETLNGRAFPSGDYSSSGVRLVRPGNLHVSGCVAWGDKNTRHLPKRYAEEYPEHHIRGSEVLINLTAQSLEDAFLGRACLSSEDDEFMLNQRIALFRPVAMEKKYCLYVLKSPLFRAFVDEGLNAGSLIQHVHTKQLKKFIFPVAPQLERLEIVRRVETAFAWIDRLSAEAKSARKLIDHLDQAVLAKAFRGELVPQDPTDEPTGALLAHHGGAAGRDNATP